MISTDMFKSTFIIASFRIKNSISRDDVNYVGCCEDLRPHLAGEFRNRRISMGQIEI